MSSEKLSAHEILGSFFDENTFVETDAFLKGANGDAEAVTGYGDVDGFPVFAFAQDVANCGGVMSAVQAKKIVKLYKLALKTGMPVVGFFNSVGGRLSEGNDLLSAYGEILRSASKLSGLVPQISVVLGNCLGTSALIASSADFVVMTKDAKLSINTSGEGASADDNAKSGTAAILAETVQEAIEKAQELLMRLPINNLEGIGFFDDAEPYAKGCIVHRITDEGSLIHLYNSFGDNARTVFGNIKGVPVGIINTKGGKLSADDAAKITKMVRFCDAFSIPVVTIVNADGFDDLRSASSVAAAYADATTVKISVINGTAVGSTYIALAGAGANADMVFATNGSVVSPVAPKAAAYILSSGIANAPVAEQDKLADEFVKAELTAEKAAADGYVDDITEEADIREKIHSALSVLLTKRVQTLPKKHTTLL